MPATSAPSDTHSCTHALNLSPSGLVLSCKHFFQTLDSEHSFNQFLPVCHSLSCLRSAVKNSPISVPSVSVFIPFSSDCHLLPVASSFLFPMPLTFPVFLSFHCTCLTKYQSWMNATVLTVNLQMACWRHQHTPKMLNCFSGHVALPVLLPPLFCLPPPLFPLFSDLHPFSLACDRFSYLIGSPKKAAALPQTLQVHFDGVWE